MPEHAIVARGTNYMLVYPIPKGPLARAVGDFAARRRKSLEVIIGNEHARAALLSAPIREDRICAVLMNGRVVGYLSYRMDGAGATYPIWQKFRARYGVLQGTLRYIATQITLHRGRRRDLYIEGFAILPETRGHGIGRALLQWLSSEVIRRGKAGWQTELPDGQQEALRAYERFGARAQRKVSTGPFAPLVGVKHFWLYRWTPEAD